MAEKKIRDKNRKVVPIDVARLGKALKAKKVTIEQAAQAAQAAGIAIEDINENGEVVWKLSERELALIAEMDKKAEQKSKTATQGNKSVLV